MAAIHRPQGFWRVTKGRLLRLVRLAWRSANSALFIAVMGSIVLAALTDLYSTRQAEALDLASRRAELEKLVVELDLRIARLKITSQQLDSHSLSQAAIHNAGARAIAIVKGDPQTVTTSPEFKGEHLISVLSRAESTAGLALTNKEYLLTFTDLLDCPALQQTRYVYARVQPLVYYLKSALADGDVPATQARPAASARQAALYEELSAQSRASAESYDILRPDGGVGAQSGGAPACR